MLVELRRSLRAPRFIDVEVLGPKKVEELSRSFVAAKYSRDIELELSLVSLPNR